ncbi:hypothetical protein D3C86_1627750 [compost metagenome]
MQVQACQLILALRGDGLAFQRLLIFIDDLLQGTEIQPQVVGRQAKQGAGGSKTHGLLAVVEQRAEQQTALAAGNQPDNALDRGLADRDR